MTLLGVSMSHQRFRKFNTKAAYPEQKLDNDLTMFGDKLSKTFNGITMS